jgi:hypothetical protein
MPLQTQLPPLTLQESMQLVSDVLFKAHWVRYLPLDGMIIYPLLVKAARRAKNREDVLSFLNRHIVFPKNGENVRVRQREEDLRTIFERSGYAYPRTMEELVDLIIRFGLLKKVDQEGKTRLFPIDPNCIPRPENVLNLTERERQILEEIRGRQVPV